MFFEMTDDRFDYSSNFFVQKRPTDWSKPRSNVWDDRMRSHFGHASSMQRWQKNKERVERFPHPDRLLKICIDAGSSEKQLKSDNTS